jgi:hypothetical protein
MMVPDVPLARITGKCHSVPRARSALALSVTFHKDSRATATDGGPWCVLPNSGDPNQFAPPVCPARQDRTVARIGCLATCDNPGPDIANRRALAPVRVLRVAW